MALIEQKDIDSYCLARIALCIGYALGEQGVNAGINLNKVAKYVFDNVNDMELPLAGMKTLSEYTADLAKD